MAELTLKQVESDSPPQAAVKIFYVTGTSAANNDTLTVTGITTVRGAFLVSTTGVVGTLTFATNAITITNGGTLVWSGIAWGQ